MRKRSGIAGPALETTPRSALAPAAPAAPGEDHDPRPHDVGDVEDSGDEGPGDEAELDRDRQPRGGCVAEAPVLAELGHDRARREPRRHRQDQRGGEERERPRPPGR